jgi:23S rRNA (uracil1939-C5)-methyltransferase
MVVESVIESLGAQGDGVTAEGVFVPFALPGERVRLMPSGHRARLDAVLQRAPERTEPPCPHFSTCGGCALQHASDRLLAEWKRDLVRRALASRGIEGVGIRPTSTSPPASRRRATFGARRTRKGALVGFHAAASDEIVAVTTCPVSDPALVAALPALAEIAEIGGSRKGTLRLTVTASERGLDIAVEGGKPIEGPMYGQLVAVAATRGLARLSWDGEPLVTRRQPIHRFGRAWVAPPPGGFLQATREGEAALVAAMREAVGTAARVVDLFAGSGTFALPLAEGAEVLAADADAQALAALDAGWRGAEGLRRVVTERRDLLHRPLLARHLAAFDAVVFDPPRAGARAQVEQLALSSVPRVGAVSCNPATFARDARALIDGGYRLDWVLPVDQFRWSPHVELAAAFSRAGSKAAG